MAGIDVRTLQQLLGHQTLQMTLRYAHLAPDHAMRAVSKVRLADLDEGHAHEVGERVVAFGPPDVAWRGERRVGRG